MITLQEVTKENFEECCNLNREDFDYVGDAESVLAEAYVYRDIATAYAIYHDDTIIGMVMANTYVSSDGTCEFTNLFISDDYRNQGFGESVVKSIVGMLVNKGAKRVKITVSKWNERARHIYEKVGFVEDGIASSDNDFVVMVYHTR